MSIQVSQPNSYKTESVFINPQKSPSDKVIKKKDADGNIIGVEVQDSNNVIAEGGNRRDVIKQVYGKKL